MRRRTDRAGSHRVTRQRNDRTVGQSTGDRDVHALRGMSANADDTLRAMHRQGAE